MFEFFEALEPYLTFENLGYAIAIADVVAGGLPNSWLKYPGIILSVAKKLQELDTKKGRGLVSMLLVCLLFSGCVGFPALSPVVEEPGVYKVGKAFARNNPTKIEMSISMCDAILNSDDERFIGESFVSIVDYWARGLEIEGVDNDDMQFILEVLKRELKLGELPMPGEVLPPLDIPRIKRAVEAFKRGAVYVMEKESLEV